MWDDVRTQPRNVYFIIYTWFYLLPASRSQKCNVLSVCDQNEEANMEVWISK